MKPRSFEYFRPSTAEEAVEILSQQDEDARFLAGGQSLVPLMNLRMAAPPALIDLNGCQDLGYVEVEGDELVIGAMVRQADAEASDVVRARCPLVAQALALNGHPATRHRGTVGGTLAHGDAVAELPGVAVALDADIVLQGPEGRRRVAAADYFVGPLITSIEPGELLREVRFPCLPEATRTRFLESGVRAHDFAIAGLAAALETDGRSCSRVRLAAVGVGSVPFRLSTLEEALVSRGLDPSLVADAVATDLAEVEVMENPHATAGYRRRLIEALARQAIEETLREGEGEIGG